MLIPSIDIIKPAYDSGYAIPSFDAWDSQTTRIILEEAETLQAPIMLMSGPGEFPCNGPDQIAAATRFLSDNSSLPVALHLDHGDSIEQVRACLDAGYTSIMLDLSSKPYKENAAALAEAVRLSQPYGATVEGEIGAVGRADNVTVEGSKESTLTDPDEAVRFVEDTGIDMVAVSIGNAHGLYTALPSFDFHLLAELRDAVSVPLVLHGGSGTGTDSLQKAISMGMAKVNIASELCKALHSSLIEQYREAQPWLPAALGQAVDAMRPIVRKWIKLCGSAKAR